MHPSSAIGVTLRLGKWQAVFGPQNVPTECSKTSLPILNRLRWRMRSGPSWRISLPAAKLKAAPPERVAARVEARAAAKTAAQSLLVEKAKTASNRAASLAGSRLAALRVRGLYHAWVLPHVHLCVWKSFEQWRRSVLALVASARLRKLGQVASLPAEPAVLGSGSKARVLEVRFSDGGTAVVPRANVELIEA